MFTGNPFTDLTVFLSPLVMQVYIVLMLLAVAIGTLFDMLHKNSLIFFTRQWNKSKAAAERPLSGMDVACIAVSTILKVVVSSGEFCDLKRRISHILMFYGFLFYIGR